MEDFIFRKKKRTISTETLFEYLENSDDDISNQLSNRINELHIDNKNIELLNIINNKIDKIENKINEAINNQNQNNIELHKKIDNIYSIINLILIKDK